MKSHPRGLIELRPGVWYVRYADAVGKMRWKKAGTKTAALMLYQKLKTQVARERLMPETIAKPSPMFAELIADCLKWSRVNKRSWKEDEWRMRRIYERFGHLRADAVGAAEIERLKNEMGGVSHLSNSTINRTLALLSLVFRLATEGGKARDNPVKKVRKMKENKARTRFLSETEELRLKEVVCARHPRHWNEIIIAIHTGMRQGEQYGLRWQDVDLDGGIITIPLSKHGERRYIPLNSAAKEALSSLPGDGENVFKIQSPRAWFSRAVDDAGLNGFRWHDLRHTFGSRLAMAGVPIRAIQELMGHKTITMTMRYSHLSPEFQREAVEKLTVVKTVVDGKKRREA